MRQFSASTPRPAPLRVSISDHPADVLSFAIDAFSTGPVALATLVEVRGGAARVPGSQMAIASDGGFCGYISGGCVEAAVAAEALLAIAEGRDRLVKFGNGSPSFDIVLPCGGGISVAIHVVRDPRPLRRILDLLGDRQAVGLGYSPARQELRVRDAPGRAGWAEDEFVTVYRPRTRLVISGQTGETDAVARIAGASSYDVVQFVPLSHDPQNRRIFDPFTAVALLHHDLDAEAALLECALRSPAFYVGALGSTRTHKKRVERLAARCFAPDEINRIKAPIGIFGPTRDATSLALSVLADIAASRLAAFG